jgi:DNA-directed RNA polymerase specialized sigma24 family protein
MLRFQELYDSYAPEVYRFAFSLSGERAEAEDITSETFVRAWVNRSAIRTETLKAFPIPRPDRKIEPSPSSISRESRSS